MVHHHGTVLGHFLWSEFFSSILDEFTEKDLLWTKKIRPWTNLMKQNEKIDSAYTQGRIDEKFVQFVLL